MASIGELTATVRADISGYVGPMRQVAATNQQVAASVASAGRPVQFLGQSLTATTGSAQTLSLAMERVEHVAVLVGAETAGLGGHFGRLAAQLSALSGAGGILALAAAGFVAIYEAMKSGSDAAEEQKRTLQDLAKAYDDFTGATAQANVAAAQAAVTAANTNTHLGITSTFHDFGRFGFTTPGIGQVRDMQAVADANKQLLGAQKALDDWTAQHSAPTEQHRQTLLRASADAARALARAMEELKAKAQESEHSDAKKFEAITKEGRAWEELKRQIVAATLAQDANNAANREAAKLLQGVKGDTSLKDAVKQAGSGSRELAQAAAQGFASAFGNALRGQSQDILGSIFTVLRDAILGAIEKLVEQKIFDALIRAMSPDKSAGSSASGIVGDVGGIITAFGAPSIPKAGTLAGGGTVMVSGASIPPALSPVQHARDQQWQALLIESNRVAEANGARWRYVSR